MIGIVGGVGPFAGKDLLEKIFVNTVANSDQEHLDVVLLSKPSKIGDRTEYLFDKIKTNPGIAIAQVILKLEKAGATVAGIPCNTAHSERIFSAIQYELEKANSKIKVLNMISETGKFIINNFPKVNKIGVLSTTGTYKSGVYRKVLENKGLEVITPTLQMQENLIHPAIYHATYGIKTKSKPIHHQALKNLLDGISFLKDQGAQAVILGCTEIPLAITETRISDMITIDPTNVLARALIHSYNPKKLKIL